MEKSNKITLPACMSVCIAAALLLTLTACADPRGEKAEPNVIVQEPDSISELTELDTAGLIEYFLGSDGAYAEAALSEIVVRLKDSPLDTLRTINDLGDTERETVCTGIAVSAGEGDPAFGWTLDSCIAQESAIGETAQRIKTAFEGYTGVRRQFNSAKLISTETATTSMSI